MIRLAYATIEDLSDYMGVDQIDLPDNVGTMIERASDLIDRYSLGRINTDRERAARLATCAQVEWWIENNDEYSRLPHFDQYRVGDFQVHTFGGKGLPELAPRAFTELFLVGLMYRSVGLR